MKLTLSSMQDFKNFLVGSEPPVFFVYNIFVNSHFFCSSPDVLVLGSSSHYHIRVFHDVTVRLVYFSGEL